MIVTEYIPIDGKCYVSAESYDKVLYELKAANDKIEYLQKQIHDYNALDGMQPIEIANYLTTKCHYEGAEEIGEYLLTYATHRREEFETAYNRGRPNAARGIE